MNMTLASIPFKLAFGVGSILFGWKWAVLARRALRENNTVVQRALASRRWRQWKHGNAVSVSSRHHHHAYESTHRKQYSTAAATEVAKTTEKEISVQWLERKLALSYILIIPIFIYMYILYSRARNELCASTGVGGMLKRPFFIDGNRVWRACRNRNRKNTSKAKRKNHCNLHALAPKNAEWNE